MFHGRIATRSCPYIGASLSTDISIRLTDTSHHIAAAVDGGGVATKTQRLNNVALKKKKTHGQAGLPKCRSAVTRTAREYESPQRVFIQTQKEAHTKGTFTAVAMSSSDDPEPPWNTKMHGRASAPSPSFSFTNSCATRRGGMEAKTSKVNKNVRKKKVRPHAKNKQTKIQQQVTV